MKISEGTISYLLGCHSFFFHPIFVIIAWYKIYRKMPKSWQVICIFLHDIGHIGKNYLTNYEEKKLHWILGAKIAGRLFGEKGYKFVAGHVTGRGVYRSMMYLPDKYSWLCAPNWWLESNRLFERQLRVASVEDFKGMIKENINNGCKNGNHYIYMKYTNRLDEMKRK
jgi:hypothetical protein